MGLRRFKSLIIAEGLRSKCFSIKLAISASGILFVLNVSTAIDTGVSTPIAYASKTSALSANPAATIFLATNLAA